MAISFVDIPAIAQILLVVAIVVALGPYILSEFGTAGGFTTGSAPQMVLDNMTDAFLTLASWQNLIILVLVVGIILGVVGYVGLGTKAV